ncbi:hypothetical protein [Alkalicoccobacillus gibsonii]|uniref:hypothetical protein n=1 Tax=Alkalicoccobacillus gibsonii TaxID=79881 RepID=UPI003514538E
MPQNKNTLQVINNNISVLSQIRKSYITQNEIFAFLKRMNDRNLESFNNLAIAFDILTFKHDERNPFPSHELLAERHDVQVRSITNAVSSLVKKGLFIVEKGKYAGMDKRKNTYDVTPLLNLFASFIEKFRESYALDLTELYDEVLKGDYKPQVVPEQIELEFDEEEKPQEEAAAEKEEEAPAEEATVFSETVQAELDKLDSKKKRIFSEVIGKHVDRLDDTTIVFYINRVLEKCNNEATFKQFATKCFDNAKLVEMKEEEDQFDRAKKAATKPVKNKGKNIMPKWLNDEVTETPKTEDTEKVSEEFNALLEELRKSKEIRKQAT